MKARVSEVIHALSETMIGTALLSYYDDLPRMIVFNIIFVGAAFPSFYAALQGKFMLSLLFLYPVLGCTAGLAQALSPTTRQKAITWRVVCQLPLTVVTSLWAVIGVVGLTYVMPLSAGMEFIRAFFTLLVAMLTPFVLCLPVFTQGHLPLMWRNAFVILIHNPFAAAGLLALFIIMTWGVAFTNGGLLIALPALWVIISVHTVYERLGKMQVIYTS